MNKKRNIDLSHYYIDLNKITPNEFTNIINILVNHYKYSIKNLEYLNKCKEYDYITVKGAYIILDNFNSLIGKKNLSYNDFIKYDLDDRINGFCNYW